MEITAYRGEVDQNEGGVWFTTDKGHAGYFGEVREYTADVAEANVLHATPDTHPEMYDIEDVEAETEKAFEIADQQGQCFDVVALHDYEGGGICYVDVAGIFEPVEECHEDDEGFQPPTGNPFDHDGLEGGATGGYPWE